MRGKNHLLYWAPGPLTNQSSFKKTQQSICPLPSSKYGIRSIVRNFFSSYLEFRTMHKPSDFEWYTPPSESFRFQSKLKRKSKWGGFFRLHNVTCVDGKTPSPWSHTRNRMQTPKIKTEKKMSSSFLLLVSNAIWSSCQILDFVWSVSVRRPG
jgi:hypothetical protein